jgi:hypothetical protein
MYTILSPQSLITDEKNSKLLVRIHGVDGSLATFTQDDGRRRPGPGCLPGPESHRQGPAG